jgi:chromosome partitioning protein
MARIFVVANQKGGVGKTTTTVNLAAALTKLGQRTLLVDLDPQGNATMGAGIDKSTLNGSVYEVLIGSSEAASVIVASPSGFDVLGANADLTAAEIGLVEAERKETRLRSALNKVRDRYDYIIIDCAPSLNMLTLNGLVAADGVVIPMQCEYYALEGLAALTGTIEHVAAGANPKLHITGILRTMFDPRNTLANDVSSELLTHFPAQVFETIIPRNVRLAEAPSHGLPVLQYDKASRGAMAYLALAAELLRRQESKRPQGKAVSA